MDRLSVPELTDHHVLPTAGFELRNGVDCLGAVFSIAM